MLKFLMIGAHPDDMDFCCGGTAILLRQRGHEAAFLSMTNGNAGHQSMAKEDLRLRRQEERLRAGKIYGIAYDTLNVEDGYLSADIRIRDQLIRYIRTYKPDVILTHRTCDYHPDHRACGQLVNDSSYLVGVPLICPDVPALRKQPVILSCIDSFTIPAPFRADIGVNIDQVIDQKIEGCLQHESQLYEWLAYDGQWKDVLEAPTREAKTEALKARQRARFAGPVKKYPAAFVPGTTYGEVFQIDEYGGKMTEDILHAMKG